jgi:DNA uptake protein ComE-like DNA-binding protein
MRLAASVCVFGIAATIGACALDRRTQLDLNAASATQLAQLRGIERNDAQRIVASRPYASKDDLLRRHVITTEQYDSIAGNVYVGPPGTPDYLRDVPPMPEGP